MVKVRRLPPPSVVAIFPDAYLDGVLIDRVAFKLRLSREFTRPRLGPDDPDYEPPRRFQRGYAMMLTEEIRRRHPGDEQQALKWEGPGGTPKLPKAAFRSSATWKAGHYVKARLSGVPGDYLSRFELEIQTNGIHLLREALEAEGSYKRERWFKSGVGNNFLWPDWFTKKVAPSRLSRRCCALVADLARSVLDEFLCYVSLALGGEAVPEDAVEIHVETIQATVDLKTEADPRLLILRMERPWEARTHGVRRGDEFEELYRLDPSGAWSIKFYEKGTSDVELLRAEVELRRARQARGRLGPSPMQCPVAAFTGAWLRRELTSRVRPRFEVMERVADDAEELPHADLLAFLPRLFEGVGLKPARAEAAARMVEELVKRGRATPDTKKGDQATVLKSLRDAGLAKYDERQHATRPLRPLEDWIVEILYVQDQLARERERAAKAESKDP